MKNNVTKLLLSLCFLLILGITGYFYWTTVERHHPTTQNATEKLLEEVKHSLGSGEELEEGKNEFKKARSEYFHNLLRDPATNSIPANNRSRELTHAQKLPTFRQLKSRIPGFESSRIQDYTWNSVGPTDIGGRTRALGIDRRNPDIIIAGAVSGGIWKSTDGGDTWDLKTPEAENFSVTSLIQHPINQDTWYYTSGEISGNTADAEGAPYFGTGVFRSNDNGETWSKIPNTNDTDASTNSPYDFIPRIAVNPVTGSVFIASNGIGIYRSTDSQPFPSGQTPSPILGTFGGHLWSDIAIAPNGTIIAVLSQEEADGDPGETVPGANPGIFMSTNDGDSWQEITPTTFPITHKRSVVTFAPSNNNIFYVFTHVRQTDPEDFHQEDNRLFRLNVETGSATDLSDNIPDFGDPVGQLWTQGGYDMEIAVKPDDENFVMIGGTNLFRGRDGFASTPSGGYRQNVANEYWIGGYANNNTPDLYPNQHPDQHVIKFDPDNPNRMWVGHDGGLSVTDDITASRVGWTSKNNSYITTQFYTSAIPAFADDNRLMGGTQDNGTPFFRAGEQQNQEVTSLDLSFADGGYAFFTQSRFFVSRQNGLIIRYNVSPTGDIASPFSFVFPRDAENQQFIHPFTIDPNDQSIMYYPGGNELWRTTKAATLANEDADGSSEFEELQQASLPFGYTISALEVTQNPENTLYYAGSSMNDTPLLKKLENASINNEAPVDVSIPAAPDESWIIDLAVNPTDGDEVIAVFSNYNVTGLFHTTDGGETWTAIEGNLTGDNNNLGPSLRSAVIIPSDEGSVYLVGTSTGLYSTLSLNGSNTQWGQEAVDEVGHAVVSHLSSRISDGNIAAATHGRGMFLGGFEGSVINPRLAEEFTLNQNYPNPFNGITTIEYDLPVESFVTINLYDLLGRKVKEVVNNERKAAFRGWQENIDMQGMASGMYIYRIVANPVTDTVSTFQDSRKMTFIKN